MEYEFQHTGGALHAVTLELSKSGQFRLVLAGDSSIKGDWQRINPHCLSLIEEEGRSHLVHLAADNKGGLHLHLNGRTYHLQQPESSDSDDSVSGAPEAGQQINENGEVLSPMPGKIVQIPVAVGDKVSRGDLLVVLESMKMENPIKSPVNGTVIALPIEEGGQAELGAPLIRLETCDTD